MVQPSINLTLGELAAEVALTLEHYQLLGSIHDSRVAPLPDARTIRYYTSLGLLDKPTIEGRQAKYGKRHLLQILAIKALQARGYPLGTIQESILGLSNDELEALLASLVEIDGTAVESGFHPVVWREIVIEPGLKLIAEDGWSPSASHEELETKIRAALAALQAQSGNGGK